MNDHCAECGMHVAHPAEYHPYLFCALRKGGVTNPAKLLRESGWQRVPEPSPVPAASDGSEL